MFLFAILWAMVSSFYCVVAAEYQYFAQETITDGIDYTKLKHVNNNVTIVHVVEIDPSKHQFDVRLTENQRDYVSTIAKRHKATVAINGANYRRGGPYNGCRLNLLYSSKALCCTGDFYAGAVVIDQQGKINLDFCKAHPRITVYTQSKKIDVALDGINVPRTSKQNIMYDSSFNSRYVYIDEEALVLNKNFYFIGKSQKIEIPSTGFVAILAIDALSDLQQEEVTHTTFTMNLDTQSQNSNIKTVLCGAGMLMNKGACCDIYEEFSHYKLNAHYGDEAAADFGNKEQQKVLIEGYHPRTAIGTKLNGNIILLVADGRSTTSTGISLKELQDIFLQFECCDALNIGGGGCSTLVINNQLMNNPSQGEERPVSEALCVLL